MASILLTGEFYMSVGEYSATLKSSLPRQEVPIDGLRITREDCRLSHESR